MTDAFDSFAQDNLTWQRYIEPNIELHWEEPKGTFQDIQLKCLMQYNTFRTWPITEKEVSGELDNQNMVAILWKDNLKVLGYLTAEGQFNFQADKDYFIHRGKKYKCEGDTLVGQAYDDPVHFYLVLRVEETTIN